MIIIFEEDILWALEESNPENPMELWELIYAIDYRQRVIASYDEIRTAIKTLIMNGDIKETTKLHYYKTQGKETKRLFTEFSESEYEKTVEKYREWFRQAEKEADTMPMELIIIVKLSSEYRKNKELLNKYQLLSDEFIQMGLPIGISHGKNNLVIEITCVNTFDPQQVYQYTLPLIEDFVKNHGGTIEVTVGRDGEAKKVHVIK